MQAPSFYSVHLGRTYTSHTWHARYLDGTCRQHGLNPMAPPPPSSSSVQMCNAITGRGSRAVTPHARGKSVSRSRGEAWPGPVRAVRTTRTMCDVFLGVLSRPCCPLGPLTLGASIKSGPDEIQMSLPIFKPAAAATAIRRSNTLYKISSSSAGHDASRTANL